MNATKLSWPRTRALAGQLIIAGICAVVAVVALDAVGPTPQQAADRSVRAQIASMRAKAGSTWLAARIDGGADLCPATAAAMGSPPDGAVPTPAVRGERRLRCADKGGEMVVVDASDAVLVRAPLVGARSLLGPLLAVLLVLLLKRPATALVIAVVTATLIGKPPLEGLAALAHVAKDTLIGGDNQLVLIFTVAMLAMVHIGIESGAYAALAARMAATGDSPDPARRTRMATVLLGLVIFFDDYANSLVVGGSMRDASDRSGMSRAKLAYFVDATSASVAGVALISTWVGFEVGLLGDFRASFSGIADSPYGIFLALLPYRFYCLLTIVAALIFAWTGRDFGPMARAEARAKLAPRPAAAVVVAGGSVREALIPVGIVLGTVLGADLIAGAGTEGDIVDIFVAGADVVGLRALAAGGIIGLVAAALLARRAGMPSARVARAGWAGVAGMAPILVILIAAMAMRSVTQDAGAPTWIAALIGDTSGALLPLASFAVAALVAFFTGSSWATMGILLPVVVPLAAPFAEVSPAWILAATAAVLDGAIFGDHCSPLSDTTVMSSAAAGVAHDEHVVTQMPYALLVMVIAALTGYLATAVLGLAPWQSLTLGVMTLFLAIHLVGRKS